MAGLWYRVGTVSVTNGSKKVTGFGTKWKTSVSKPDKGHPVHAPDGRIYELDYVESDTVLWLVSSYAGATAADQAYAIDIARSGTNSAFSRDLSAFVAYHQGQMDGWQKLLTGTGDVTLTAPDGTKITIPSWDKVMNAGYGVVAQATVQADRAASAAASINAEAPAGAGQLMRVGGPAILDSERYSLERATGGKQTIIRDNAGNANAMFVLPRFRYDDLGMAADMGSGDVTAFDFGSGSIKSEIFIGVYLASGEGAISAPRAVPRTYVEQSTARAACAGKGVGWHLMTAHEWAAVALWCMANGYEPIGNTGWGRSHEKTWLVGDRLDNLSPGDTAGEARTLAGSLGAEATHDRIGGISDMVGNVWEWQDGFLLRSGQVIASTHNAQPQAEWSPQAAYFDNHNSTPMLSDSVTRTASANVEWRALGKGANYVSNQLLKRLMVEPSTVLPKGKLIVNNEGEQLPIRGGAWSSTTDAGLAAIGLFIPQATTNPYVGFRPAFA